MRVLIAGSAGQLGRALAATIPAGVVVVARTRAEFDISDSVTVHRTIADACCDVLINAAAYTAVDEAEVDEAAASRLNANAVAVLAQNALRANMRFVHISTDYVFDGMANRPYEPATPPSPVNSYGRTKLAGEQAAAAAPNALIVRTAWLYGAEGSNFVYSMLRAMAERDEVRVVADQIGTPTHAPTLARTIWALLDAGASGIFHCTDAGLCSWYDFAVAIQEEAASIGLLTRQVPIVPIRTEDYPFVARRPAYSVLDKTATWAVTGVAPHWRQELRSMLATVQALKG